MAHPDYLSVLESLYALEAARGMDFKLERVALALRHLGDPHRRFPCVHIAGTNGKGSVAAMIHSILWQGGYRVGLYTSPHLVDFRERILVAPRGSSGTSAVAEAYRIEEAEVVEYAREIGAAATARGIDLTFFELATVMAFLHFARRRVDLGVVEVGLGGRLDATNVIDPEVAAVVSIGMDHQEYLGDSIVQIAAEKAGIIKKGRPVVIGAMPIEALEVVEATARSVGAPAHRLGRDFRIGRAAPGCYESDRGALPGLEIGLLGSHQQHNAAVALRVVELLGAGLPVGEHALRQGLQQVIWPGRLDIAAQNPLLLIDGAHNEEGMRALCDALPHVVSARPRILLFGVMRDKRWAPMVDQIAGLVDGAVLVQVDAKRGLAAALLAERFAPRTKVWIGEEVPNALDLALQLAGRTGAVVVAGSLFLAGAVYAALGKRALPVTKLARELGTELVRA